MKSHRLRHTATVLLALLVSRASADQPAQNPAAESGHAILRTDDITGP